MPGNTLGKNIKVTTFGESHGKAVGVVIDGVKPGLKISTSASPEFCMPVSIEIVRWSINGRLNTLPR